MTSSDTGLHYVIYRDYSTPIFNRYEIEYRDAHTGRELTFSLPVSCMYSYTIRGAHRKARKAKQIINKINQQGGAVDEGVI